MPESLEPFSEDERRRLASFFTNVDSHVFGLKLPQEVAGALFSRYSRTAKSLRRVFLDEFLGEGVADAAPAADPEDALAKARAFYDRVLVGYGDDSVAQLGGAHVACERVSNVGAKLLEDARVGAAFLEKSTRYVRFDQKGPDGEWLFFREPAILESRHREAYLGLMERLFATYAKQIDPMIESIEKSLPIEGVEVRHPKTGEPLSWSEVGRDAELKKGAERAYKATVRAHACDVMRSYLPAATLTNVGLFATGQAYEHLLNKLASQDLREGSDLAAAIRTSVDALIPSFVKRSGRKESLVEATRCARARAATFACRATTSHAEPGARLLDFDPDAESRLLAALLYPHASESLGDLRALAAALSPADRAAAFRELAAARRSRRDKPPRALENVSYTFDIVANLGAYRDLQRHRLLTQERQDFTTSHGYDVPPEIEGAGFADEFQKRMDEAGDLYERIHRDLPKEAQYVVPFAFRTRWYFHLNLREAVHLCELRSMPQGHPDYRVIVQEMWRRIEEVHPSLAVFGRFVNRDSYRLGRLQSEMKTEWKREALSASPRT